MKNITNHYDGWELEHFDSSENFRKYQYRLISKFIGSDVAEVGPGNGSNAKMYIKNCKTLELFEPEKKLYLNLKKIFKKYKKVKIKNKIFKMAKNKYNTILYLDVIEHIKNDKHEISKAYQSLKKNGFLVINVPAFQILYSKFDNDIGHKKRYVKNDFLRLSKNLKFEIHYMKYYDSIGFFLSLISKFFSSEYKKNFKLKIKIWNFLINFSRIIDYLFAYSFGKSLLVIIKKK